MKQIILANPRGFCAGVDRAIAIVEKVLEQHGSPVYVRHEIVHNRYVVEDLKRKGAIFVEELDEVPQGAIVIFSAHGVSQEVVANAKSHQLQIYDATCPLVIKVHLEVKRMHDQGKIILMIGHKGHPEVIGTMGQIPNNIYLVESVDCVNNLNFNAEESERLAYVTQTTLSVDEASSIIHALKEKYPAIISPKKEDICYATQNRQDAVKKLALETQFIIVVGSPNSSNSNRLKEVAIQYGVPAIMIDDTSQIDPSVLQTYSKIGVTAGASAPEVLVKSVIDFLKNAGVNTVNELDGIEEHVTFAMPKNLA